MPELPEVETVRLALTPVLKNRYIAAAFVGRDNLRWPLPKNLAARLYRRQCTGIDRRGKYMLIYLDQKEILLLHLGMSGSVRIHDRQQQLGKHDHIMLTIATNRERLDVASNYVVLNDPRRFGWVDMFPVADLAQHKLLRQIGPEPLGNSFNATHLRNVFRGRRGPVKNALLNQQLIAGLGNIYASEALFYAGISPRRKAATIAGQRAERLATAVVKTLRAAIEDGGTSLRDHVQPNGQIGYFAQQLAVYGRYGDPCINCATPIKMLVQSGRSSFYCPRCQR